MKELTLQADRRLVRRQGQRPGRTSPRQQECRSDSRKVRSGDLFVALKGAKADGHDFAETAINHGAVAALVSRPISEKLPSIEVEDALRAYGEIAAGYRKLTGVKVAGITGSVGRYDHEGNDRQRPRGGRTTRPRPRATTTTTSACR